MQILFMVTTFALSAILIYSLCVNGRKIKDLSEKKDKQISELSDTVREKTTDLHEASSKISELRNKIEELSLRINGGRVCDGYCSHCDHSINSVKVGWNGEYTQYICELSCMCKDFKRKTEMEVAD